MSEKTKWTELCVQVAEMTDGLSGREIAHMAQDWQVKALVSETGELTPEIMLDRTKAAIEKKDMKVII